jgi:predicted  nucleic acid-binding Zn-ribbon protein
MQEYPELYARFKAGSEPVLEGTPLAEWPMMSGSAMRELQYLGFKTVEQLSVATDDVKRKLGPLSKFAKLAKEWLDAASSDQNAVVKLKQQLELETKKRESLEHKLELLMQRVEANEGTDLRPARRAMAEELVEEDVDLDESTDEPKRRGRPRKV